LGLAGQRVTGKSGMPGNTASWHNSSANKTRAKRSRRLSVFLTRAGFPVSIGTLQF